jgi:excisionase family DNA binding protein
MLDDKVISLHDAATRTGVSQSTLRRLAARKELKIIRLSLRRVGIRESELARWMDSRALA